MLVRSTAPKPGAKLPQRSPSGSGSSPLLNRTDHQAPSVFRPENLLREARRQKGIAEGAVPTICVLDPDGDVVAYVRSALGARRSRHWACYHTDMWEWAEEGITYGVVGHAVGGAFAVLVAEQLFVSGCEFLVGIMSAGRIADQAELTSHILIERALRDEGTSHHYLPPAPYVEADPALLGLALAAFAAEGCDVQPGATWTTDAPFRETETAIAWGRAAGVHVVEMEAAALYAFGAARRCPVLCLAHVTNELGRIHGDFEKGAHNGAISSLRLLRALSAAWRMTEPNVAPKVANVGQITAAPGRRG
jgi:uridine phosphorylase